MLFQMLIIIYSIISIVGIVVIALLMKNAPIGWEDKNGFHIGKKDQLSISKNEVLNSREYFLKYYYMPITGNNVHIF